MAKELPILFTVEMVKAIRKGRKTVTRRVIKPQPEVFDNAGFPDYTCLKDSKKKWEKGDLLWVREGWRCTGGGTERNIIYRADGDTPMSLCGIDDGRKSILHVAEPYWAEWDRLVYETDKGCNWRSPLFMPKWVARTWLEVVSVRPERLQDISISEIRKEGVVDVRDTQNTILKTYHECWIALWDSINAKRGYSWESNPWIWRIEFKELKHLKQGRDEESKTT